MAYQRNDAAVRHAAALIRQGRLDTETAWGDAEPSAERENALLDRDGFRGYAQWYLAVDPQATAGTKGSVHFPYGDGDRVYRSALIAAKQRAAQNDHADVEEAAAELLTLIDHTTG